MGNTLMLQDRRWTIFAATLLGVCATVFLWGTLYPAAWLALNNLSRFNLFLSLIGGWLPPEVITVQAALLIGGVVAFASLLGLWGRVIQMRVVLGRPEAAPLTVAIAMTFVTTAAALSMKTLAWQGVIRRVQIEKRLYPAAAYLFSTRDAEYRTAGGEPPEVDLIRWRFITRGDGHYVTPPPGYGLLGESLSFYEVFVTPPTVRIPLSLPHVSVIVSYEAAPRKGDLIEEKYARSVIRRVTDLGGGAYVVETANDE